MKKYNNPTANHLRPFIINEIQMDLSIVNSSLKKLGEMELKDDNLKIGGKSDVQSKEE